MDRFDDIWKNRFNEEKFPIGEWNSPDDDVWEGIMGDVIPKKDKRRLLWFWLSLGIILTLALMAILIDGGKIENTENQIPDQDQFGTLISKNKNDTTEKGGAQKDFDYLKKTKRPVNVSPSDKVNFEKNTFSGKKNNNTFTKKSHTHKSDLSKKNMDAGTTSYQAESEAILKKSLSEFSDSNVMDKNDGIRQLRKEVLVSKISFANIFLGLKQNTYPVTIFSTAIVDDLTPPKFGKITLGVQAGAVFWKHRISDQYTTDLSPFDFNYQNNWGWQTSLTMNIDLGKYVDATIGFQYEQIRTTSGHNSNLTYSLDDEDNPSNPLNQYALSLATPYGLSGATFNFNRNQILGANEVDLLVDFHSSHLIKNINVPVGAVIYPFGKKRKLVPSASIGFGVNYLASISNSIQNIETHHSAIQFEDSGSASFVAPTLEKWHFDYRIGVGLNYELTRSLRLNFNYDWSRGINPIFELENYKTRIDRHHLSLGLTKLFRLEK